MKKDVQIILAEDDEGHAALIEKNLQRAGLQNRVVHKKEGKETLEYLYYDVKENKDRGYVILLDIKMPGMDGKEILKEIKRDEVLKQIPVIMITTTDNQQVIQKCYKIGCNNYLVKPLDYNDFKENIRRLALFLEIVEIPPLG